MNHDTIKLIVEECSHALNPLCEDDGIGSYTIECALRALLPSLIEKYGNEWVSVGDRLPECKYEDTTNEIMVSQSVMVTDDTNIGIGHCDSNKNWIIYGHEYNCFIPEIVTHWMPLPKPSVIDTAIANVKG